MDAAAALSGAVRQAIEAAQTVLVAPCSVHEIARKHRPGEWPEVSGMVDQMPQPLRAQGGMVAPYTATLAMPAGGMDWSHRDPFDRMIAATAIEMVCPVVSRDSAFDELRGRFGWSGPVW